MMKITSQEIEILTSETINLVSELSNGSALDLKNEYMGFVKALDNTNITIASTNNMNTLNNEALELEKNTQTICEEIKIFLKEAEGLNNE